MCGPYYTISVSVFGEETCENHLSLSLSQCLQTNIQVGRKCLTCSKPPRSSVVSMAELVFKISSGCPVSWAAKRTRLVFPLALGPTFEWKIYIELLDYYRTNAHFSDDILHDPMTSPTHTPSTSFQSNKLSLVA